MPLSLKTGGRKRQEPQCPPSLFGMSRDVIEVTEQDWSASWLSPVLMVEESRRWSSERPPPDRCWEGATRLRRRCLDFRLARLSGSTIFLNDTAPAEIYTLSLHDALPI